MKGFCVGCKDGEMELSNRGLCPECEGLLRRSEEREKKEREEKMDRRALMSMILYHSKIVEKASRGLAQLMVGKEVDKDLREQIDLYYRGGWKMEFLEGEIDFVPENW